MTPYERLQQTIKEGINRRGREIIVSSSDETTFSYTIGNHLSGLPELLLIGNFTPEGMAHVLNSLSDKMMNSRTPFTHGEKVLIDPDSPMHVQVWNAQTIVKNEYTVQAGQFFNSEEYDVQQVVLPDEMGYLPGDVNCDANFCVPIYKRALH